MNLPVLPSRPSCVGCDLHAESRHVGMATLYDEDSLPPSRETPAVVFIGKSPSYVEERQGEPFAGPSGVVARRVYRNGVSLHTRASVYYTNIVRCRTGPGDPDPKKRQTQACRPHLFEDLHAIASTCSELYLLLCGAPPCKALLDRSLRDALHINGRRLTLTP